MNLIKPLLSALAAAALLSACAHPTHPNKETAMTQTGQQTFVPPVLTPPEVLTKAADFIRTAQSPKDFKIGRAEEIMKMKFGKREGNRGLHDFAVGNEFGDSGWGWAVAFPYTEQEIKDKDIATMYLYISKGDLDIPATAVCQLDLDQFHLMLEQAGFTYTGKGHVGRPFNGYIKDYANGYRADAWVFYEGESMEKIMHKCINEINFRVYKKLEV